MTNDKTLFLLSLSAFGFCIIFTSKSTTNINTRQKIINQTTENISFGSKYSDVSSNFTSTSRHLESKIKHNGQLQFPRDRSEAPRCKYGIRTPEEMKIKMSNRIGMQELKNDSFPNYQPSEQNQILVLAQHRSGSSFFSELLNLHPEVFYLYEPMYQIEERFPEKISPETWPLDFRPVRTNIQNEILHRFYDQCKLPNPEYSNDWCRSGGTCFREMHDMFQSPPYCLQTKGLRLKTRNCQCPIGVELSSKICRKYKNIAAKFIRVQSVMKIPVEIRNRLRILILIRDPRGIAASRMSTQFSTGPGKLWSQKNPTVFWKFGEICKVYDLFLKEKSETGFPENVMVVRYEDVLFAKEKWAEKIYKFLGLKMHPRVVRDLIQGKRFNKANPMEYAKKWIKKLEWRTVQKIQTSCQRVFDEFGYKTIREDEFNLSKEFINQNNGSHDKTEFW